MTKATYLVLDGKYKYMIDEGTEADIHDWKKVYGDKCLIARVIYGGEKESTPGTYSAPEGECLDKYLKENT